MTNEITIQNPVPYSDLERMAHSVVKSRLFGVDNLDQALSLMLLAQSEGMHPARAMQEYHVIQGRPALKADAMLARFQKSGGVVEWQEMTDTRVAGLFSHPKACPKPVMIDWDINRAKAAELGGKGMWKKYPRQMLRARVISEGVRATYPGVAIGVYTPEEVEDFEPKRPEKISGNTVGAAVMANEGEPTTEELKRWEEKAQEFRTLMYESDLDESEIAEQCMRLSAQVTEYRDQYGISSFMSKEEKRALKEFKDIAQRRAMETA